MRPSSSSNSSTSTNQELDAIQRIRILFVSPENATIPLLLGFVPNGMATDGFDYGYDAPKFDNFPSDLSFTIENENYAIQGVGPFDETKVYPLTLELNEAGTVEIMVSEIENFDEVINVYLHDELLNTYTLINNDSTYEYYLEAGVYNNRFYITFNEDETLDLVEQEFSKVQVSYLHQSDEIYIKTPESINIKQVYLINILGQTIKDWNYNNHTFNNEFRLPVSNVAEGSYIVKVETDDNTSINKKIVIKY